MFEILADKTICVTRGDVADFDVSARLKDGKPYVFSKGDVVRFQIFKRKDCTSIIVKKDFIAEEESEYVSIHLTSLETRIGEPINAPYSYWYEVVVNPDTSPKTIIGYDIDGEKLFKIYPEGVSK